MGAIGINFTQNLTNTNVKGVLDVVPGGGFDAQGETKDAIDAALHAINNINTTYRPYHSFIPTISSLGFKNPNFHWGTRVDDRNLLCNEIFFDNYFVPHDNEEHITLTPPNVAWVKQEIDYGKIGCPIVCSFKIINGTDVICSNTPTTFNLDAAIPSGATISWSVSGGLQILSQTNNGITVKALSTNNNAYIKALITPEINGIQCGASTLITRKISTLVSPSFSIGFSRIGSACEYEAEVSPYNPSYIYEWSDDGVSFNIGGETFGAFAPHTGADDPVWCRITTPCGIITEQDNFTLQTAPGGCIWRLANPASQNNEIMVSPNPSEIAWNIKLPTSFEGDYHFLLFDISGKVVWSYNKNDSNNHLVIANENLALGIYHLQIRGKEEVYNFKLLKN